MNLLYQLGEYTLLMGRVFKKPENWKVYRKQMIKEIYQIGITSLPIVAIISVFMGGVITIQAAFGFTSPWVPLYAIGFTTRESIILEFSPTIVSLILAGKVGSNIASEIGAMRITEQIDALEIMGINPACYLILPKILAAVFINPFLIAISMFLGLMGGYTMGIAANAVTSYEYIFGIQSLFQTWKIWYAFTKVIVFAFIITSVPAYYGYYTRGGALEVGKSSTRAVVISSILILIFNLIITQIFFT